MAVSNGRGVLLDALIERGDKRSNGCLGARCFKLIRTSCADTDYTRQPCCRKRSTIPMHGIPRSLHTSGIFGLRRFPLAFSPVTTVSPCAEANAITQGSQPDRFFLVSTSRP